MNVFVLSTGRSGTVTFIEACQHLSNFSAGHETRSMAGSQRFAYPDQHIEADNRLTWMLGRLDEHFGNDAFYVHLIRDPDSVAASYNRRWHVRGGIATAYDRAILRSDTRDLSACRDLVATMEANIRMFVKDKPSQIELCLESIESTFPTFLERIGASGDLAAATAAWQTRHNAGPPRESSGPRRLLRRGARFVTRVPDFWRESQ